MAARGFQPKNSLMFKGNKGGKGTGVYNGFGTTRTAQSPTLFVTNLPPGLPTQALQQLFELDDGFSCIRTVRHMIFVDFHDIRTATRAMQRHNNAKFEGFQNVKQGIMIDYDKDPRGKVGKG